MRLNGLMAGLTAALLLVGCAEMSGTRPAETQTTLSATAVVQSANPKTRELVLKGPEGGELRLVAGPEVRNFDQIAKGDNVTVAYHEATVLTMADATTPQATATLTAGRTPKGATPGGAAALTTSIVVTVVSYDPNTGTATFRTPDGLTRRAVVPPELREPLGNWLYGCDVCQDVCPWNRKPAATPPFPHYPELATLDPVELLGPAGELEARPGGGQAEVGGRDQAAGDQVHDPRDGATGLDRIEAVRIDAFVEALGRALVEDAALRPKRRVGLVVLLVFAEKLLAGDGARLAAMRKVARLDRLVVELVPVLHERGSYERKVVA